MDFSELDPDVQKQLIMIFMQGKPQTPDNQNRARAALQSNPDLVAKLIKENNLEDGADGKDPDGTETPDPDAAKEMNLGMDDDNDGD